MLGLYTLYTHHASHTVYNLTRFCSHMFDGDLHRRCTNCVFSDESGQIQTDYTNRTRWPLIRFTVVHFSKRNPKSGLQQHWQSDKNKHDKCISLSLFHRFTRRCALHAPTEPHSAQCQRCW